MEAWDGPAGLVIQDGRHAICMLDRNGLRPARWVITKNDYITLASEIGVWGYEPEDVVSKGRRSWSNLGCGDTLQVKCLILKTLALKTCVRTVSGYVTMQFA